MLRPVHPLEPPDTHRLRAATGWLELGNAAAAEEELERIAPVLRTHPDVLDVRWHLCAQSKRWEAAAEVAHALVLEDPERPDAWVHRSYALHELKRTQARWISCCRSQIVSRKPGPSRTISPVTRPSWVDCRKRFALQRSGAFPVDREGADLAAVRTAMNLLRECRHPLVIFPEGEIHHHQEEWDLLNEGVATILLRAAG